VNCVTEQDFRRIPKQARSRERYDQILEIASKLFSEKGFERTTTNEIASLAGMSVGSLYQYFRNKEAIVAALMEGYLEAAREFTDSFIVQDVRDLPVSEAVDQLLDPYVRHHTHNAAFSRLWLGADLSDRLDSAIGSMTDRALERIETLVRARMPGIRRDRVRVIALVTQGIVKSLLSLLMRTENPRVRNQAAREVKRMLVDYFESLIREHQG
jgi:AcrR family transcriptional regulator